MYRLNINETLIRSFFVGETSVLNVSALYIVGSERTFVQNVVVLKSRSQERLVEQRCETVNLVEFWDLPP